MATTRWKGAAASVAQVQSYLFGGAWEATDVVNLVIGAKTLSVVAGSTTIATIIDTIVTAWSALDASLWPEFAEITPTRSTSTLVLTHGTEGVPFTCTLTTTETGGGAADAQTIDGAASSAGTATTAATSPNHWSVAGNWSGAAVPVSTDTVWAEYSDVPILYGLDQSAVTLAALWLQGTHTGGAGLPEVSQGDAGTYLEYRGQYLQIGATLLNVGQGGGQGADLVKIDNGSVQTTAVLRGGRGSGDGLPALIWKGTHASNAVEVNGGSVGAAVYGGEVATIATLRVVDGDDGGTSFLGGAGLTLATLIQQGGEVVLNAGLTTASVRDGECVLRSGNVTTVNADGGTVRYDGIGTIGTLNVSGRVDFSGEMRSCVVTNCNIYKGAELYDPHGRVTFTNPAQLVRCRVEDITIDVGVHRTLAFA